MCEEVKIIKVIALKILLNTLKSVLKASNHIDKIIGILQGIADKKREVDSETEPKLEITDALSTIHKIKSLTRVQNTIAKINGVYNFNKINKANEIKRKIVISIIEMLVNTGFCKLITTTVGIRKDNSYPPCFRLYREVCKLCNDLHISDECKIFKTTILAFKEKHGF